MNLPYPVLLLVYGNMSNIACKTPLFFVCGCKGTTTFPTDQIFRQLFSKILHFFRKADHQWNFSGDITHIIYMTMADFTGQLLRSLSSPFFGHHISRSRISQDDRGNLDRELTTGKM